MRLLGSSEREGVASRWTICALLSHLRAQGLRFVIRGCYDRRILESASNLTAYMATLPVNNERHVALSARTKKHREVRNQPRDERLATLEIRAGTVTFRRPKNLPAGDLPSRLEVNVVHVLERNPPEGATPVEWVLLTTEPIETQEGILRVVNIYLRRWLIEEYFKVLPRQQNLWAISGSGKRPSSWYSAVSATS